MRGQDIRVTDTDVVWHFLRPHRVVRLTLFQMWLSQGFTSISPQEQGPRGTRAAECWLLSRATVNGYAPVILQFIQVSVRVFPILVNGS